MAVNVYFDGETAQKRLVEVRHAADALELLDADGTVLARWPLADMVVRADPAAGAGLAVRPTRDSPARLLVEDPMLATALRGRVHRHLDVAGILRSPWTWVGVGLVAALVFLLVGPLPVAESVARMIPRAWVSGLGESVLERGFGEAEPCTERDGLAALGTMQARLEDAAAARRGRVERFEVSVLDLDMVNAFALPGGRIVLTSGLVAAMDGPDQLGFVLAHEMAHALERHPTAGLVRQLGLSVVLELVAGGGGVGDTLGGLGGLLAMLSYTRADEEEADRIGSELLVAADGDPTAIAGAFANLSAAHGTDAEGAAALPFELPEWLSTHPDTARRVQAVEAHAEAAGRDAATARPLLDDAAWESLQRICPAGA